MDRSPHQWRPPKTRRDLPPLRCPYVALLAIVSASPNIKLLRCGCITNSRVESRKQQQFCCAGHACVRMVEKGNPESGRPEHSGLLGDLANKLQEGLLGDRRSVEAEPCPAVDGDCLVVGRRDHKR